MDNFDARHSYIDFDALTQPFQDAIVVTRRLGVPFIWIDSLCIIQEGDDGGDWRHEALRMGQYYNYALLTIAASFCPGASGFLTPRRPWLSKMFQLPYYDKAGTAKGHFYVAPLATLPAQHFRQVTRSSILATRGWVFQEWLLSRRMIYYTQDSTWLECLSKDARSDLNYGAGSDYIDRVAQRSSEIQLARLKELFHTGNLPYQDLWCRIVELYSDCRLTRPNDRLVAISGIADHVRSMVLAQSQHGITGSNIDHAYICGWWYGAIHIGLLWEQYRRLRGDEQGIPGRHIWQLPTWSWSHWYFSVFWRSSAASMTPACHVQRVASPETPAALLKRDAVPENIEGNEKYLSINDRFACLEIRGKTGLVLLGPLVKFLKQQNLASKLAKHTGVRPSPNDRNVWCSISCPEAPDEHIGWADIETDTSLKDLESDGDLPPERPILYTLHVCTQKNVEGGWAFGRSGLTHEVYAVLFLLPIERGGFLRAGVGRIYRQDFFKNAEEVTVSLW